MNGSWLLCEGCKRGDEVAVQELLTTRGVNPNLASSANDNLSSKALHIAAERLRSRVVKILLNHGAHVDVQDGWQQTPLARVCAALGRIQVPHAGSRNDSDQKSQTPLSPSAATVSDSDESSIKSESESRASTGDGIRNLRDFRRQLDSGREILEMLCQGGADYLTKDSLSNTIFHRLAATSSLEAFLLIHNHFTQHMATKSGHQSHGHRQLRSSLDDHLWSPGDELVAPGWGRLTPCHVAAEADNHQVLQGLLDCYEQNSLSRERECRGLDAAVNSRDAICWTPLHWAAKNGHQKCIQLLLRYGANLGLTDYVSRTPVDVALAFGQSSAARLLFTASFQYLPGAFRLCDLSKEPPYSSQASQASYDSRESESSRREIHKSRSLLSLDTSDLGSSIASDSNVSISFAIPSDKDLSTSNTGGEQSAGSRGKSIATASDTVSESERPARFSGQGLSSSSASRSQCSSLVSGDSSERVDLATDSQSDSRESGSTASTSSTSSATSATDSSTDSKRRGRVRKWRFMKGWCSWGLGPSRLVPLYMKTGLAGAKISAFGLAAALAAISGTEALCRAILAVVTVRDVDTYTEPLPEVTDSIESTAFDPTLEVGLHVSKAHTFAVLLFLLAFPHLLTAIYLLALRKTPRKVLRFAGSMGPPLLEAVSLVGGLCSLKLGALLTLKYVSCPSKNVGVGRQEGLEGSEGVDVESSGANESEDEVADSRSRCQRANWRKAGSEDGLDDGRDGAEEELSEDDWRLLSELWLRQTQPFLNGHGRRPLEGKTARGGVTFVQGRMERSSPVEGDERDRIPLRADLRSEWAPIYEILKSVAPFSLVELPYLLPLLFFCQVTSRQVTTRQGTARRPHQLSGQHTVATAFEDRRGLVEYGGREAESWEDVSDIGEPSSEENGTASLDACEKRGELVDSTSATANLMSSNATVTSLSTAHHSVSTDGDQHSSSVPTVSLQVSSESVASASSSEAALRHSADGDLSQQSSASSVATSTMQTLTTSESGADADRDDRGDEEADRDTEDGSSAEAKSGPVWTSLLQGLTLNDESCDGASDAPYRERKTDEIVANPLTSSWADRVEKEPKKLFQAWLKDFYRVNSYLEEAPHLFCGAALQTSGLNHQKLSVKCLEDIFESRRRTAFGHENSVKTAKGSPAWGGGQQLEALTAETNGLFHLLLTCLQSEPAAQQTAPYIDLDVQARQHHWQQTLALFRSKIPARAIDKIKQPARKTERLQLQVRGRAGQAEDARDLESGLRSGGDSQSVSEAGSCSLNSSLVSSNTIQTSFLTEAGSAKQESTSESLASGESEGVSREASKADSAIVDSAIWMPSSAHPSCIHLRQPLKIGGLGASSSVLTPIVLVPAIADIAAGAVLLIYLQYMNFPHPPERASLRVTVSALLLLEMTILAAFAVTFSALVGQATSRKPHG